MKKNLDLNYTGFLSQDAFSEDSEFIPIVTDEGEDDLKNLNIPDVLPILPLKNMVLFPGVVIPITVAREKSLSLIKDVYQKSKIIGTLAQINPEIENPELKDLYNIGTVAQILKILEMPDGTTSVIIQGKKRFQISDIVSDNPYLLAKIDVLEDIKTGDIDELKAIVGSLKDLSMKIMK